MSDLTEKASPMWKGELYKKYIPLFSRARSYVRTKTHLYHFVEEYTRQLLTRQLVQVDEAIQDIAKFYLPGKTVGELLILELEQIGKRLYKNGDTVGARTIRKAIELLTQKRMVTREEISLLWDDGSLGTVDEIVELFEELGIKVDEEEEQPPMDRETAGDMKYHALKDEGLLDKFGRRKQ